MREEGHISFLFLSIWRLSDLNVETGKVCCCHLPFCPPLCGPRCPLPLLAKGPQVPPQPGVTSAPKLLAPLPLVRSHSPSLARDAISGGRGQRAPSPLACDD